MTGDLNVGSILRSAVLFGFRKATIFGRRKYDKRSTVGAQNYIDVDFVDGMKSETEIDEEMFFKFLNSKPEHLPCFIEYVENYSQSVHILGVLGQTDPLMLIFGNEGLGIPEIILDVYKDSTYSIPQRGVMRSLNVAAAAAIAMYETVR